MAFEAFEQATTLRSSKLVAKQVLTCIIMSGSREQYRTAPQAGLTICDVAYFGHSSP